MAIKCKKRVVFKAQLFNLIYQYIIVSVRGKELGMLEDASKFKSFAIFSLPGPVL